MSVLQVEWNVERALSCIASKNLSDAEDACVFLENKVRNDRDLDLINSVHQVSREHAADAVGYMRFMKMLCKFSTFEEEAFRRCESIGAIDDIVRLCTTDDILVQINAIELLSQLAQSHAGLEHIVGQGIIYWLITTGCGGAPGNTQQSSMADPLISTEALRVLAAVFSQAANQKFNMLERVDTASVQHFLRTIYRHLEEGSEGERLTGNLMCASPDLYSGFLLIVPNWYDRIYSLFCTYFPRPRCASRFCRDFRHHPAAGRGWAEQRRGSRPDAVRLDGSSGQQQGGAGGRGAAQCQRGALPPR